jgi:hypothetical protein
MADELIVDDADAYAEEPITPAAQLPPLPPPPTQLTELIIRNSLNVSALKDELKKRGRQTGGNKSALIKRLVEAVNANVPVTENAVKRHESMNGLDVTEEWIPLTKNPIPIAEPTNEDANLRPPTERDAPVNAKYEFMERFDRLSFSGTTKNMKYIDGAKTSPCKKAIHKFTPQRMFRNEPQPRKMGGPNEKFLKRHNLDERSHPMDWFTALMPLSEGSNLEDAAKANVTGDKTTKFSVANWAKYANTKASLVHAGQPGHKFEGKYKPLTPSDITKMMGLMILDGLFPSPQLEWKMQSQAKQRVHRNDFVASCIGSAHQQLYRTFRCFFACQDPLKIPPPKPSCPNVKVDEFFRWMRFIFAEAWELGENCSVDEQTCRMQGKSEYKTRCGKYKRIGDGIQADCIADDRYTYAFYFRNEPIDKKWTDKGMCPMHARLLHMFEKFPDVGHRVKMDNLFVSVNLAREAYALHNKVLIHGVIRQSQRGVPPVVLQEPLFRKSEERARGMLKAAVLKNDSKSSDLVVASCYDQKPFYMLSHSTDSVGWAEKVKTIYSTALNKSVEYKFLFVSTCHTNTIMK